MKKFSLFIPLVLATVLVVGPLFAQSEPKEEKPEAAAVVRDTSPAAQVRDFFRILSEGRVDAAYDQLLKGTKIAESPADVTKLKKMTREAIRVFGAINGYDLVGEKKVGNGFQLTRLTCISLGKQFPIRWRFYFYNAESNIARPEGRLDGVVVGGAWRLIDIRIDDRLMDMFEEPAPAVTSGSAK